jgi:hypothetical protein
MLAGARRCSRVPTSRDDAYVRVTGARDGTGRGAARELQRARKCVDGRMHG